MSVTRTYNELIAHIAVRVRELANEPIDVLRRGFPETTETDSELIRLCKERGLSRGDIIEAILLDEYSEEFDFDMTTETTTKMPAGETYEDRTDDIRWSF